MLIKESRGRGREGEKRTNDDPQQQQGLPGLFHNFNGHNVLRIRVFCFLGDLVLSEGEGGESE